MSNPLHRATIGCLPDEVLEFILSYVSPYGDLEACSRTCRRWRMCCKNVHRKRLSDFDKAILGMRLVWSSYGAAVIRDLGRGALEVGKRYSHCAACHPATDSMFVFGGCTSSATTFNDLWKLDLTSRSWQHVLTTGTYPSPKACAVMVLVEDKLFLFGGWSYPSVGNRWKLFNELHEYDITNARWTKILPDSSVKPPTMAGHSATVHNGHIIVFGGLQKQRNSIGQFSSSSDVWSFDLSTMEWSQKDIPTPRPKPRYGQSQLRLDDNHILILGGCGGPSNVFNDVWLLEMLPPHWRWIQCRIENPQWGTHHMWCHPAVKVNDYAVMLDKNRLPRAATSVNRVAPSPSLGAPNGQPDNDTVNGEYSGARWNVIPQLRRGVNRGYGAIRRPNHPHRRLEHQSSQQEGQGSPPERPRFPKRSLSVDGQVPAAPQDDSDELDEPQLAVLPVANSLRSMTSGRGPEVFRSSVSLKVNEEPSASGSPQRPQQTSPWSSRPVAINQLPMGPRLQAFAVDSPQDAARSKQLETRQRQLEVLRRMEERYKNISSENVNVTQKANSAASPPPPPSINSCSCQRLAVHVLDISRAISDHVVAWTKIKSNTSPSAPDETILYTLTLGRGELIMFGGIQKDVAAMTSRAVAAAKESDTVSNALYFLSPPGDVI